MRDCDVHVPVCEYIIVKWMSYTVVTPGWLRRIHLEIHNDQQYGMPDEYLWNTVETLRYTPDQNGNVVNIAGFLCYFTLINNLSGYAVCLYTVKLFVAIACYWFRNRSFL